MAGNRYAKPDINGVIGASGSGKTTYVMNQLKRRKPRRLMVWDKKGEFAREGYGQPVTKISDVLKILKAAGSGGAFKICFKPRGDGADKVKQFNIFCQAAFAIKNVLFVAEELSDVTSASHAPEGWKELTTQGRTEGIVIFGLSQSPAQIDKDFFGNCSLVRTGRLNFDSHIKAMANCMSCKPDDIRNLQPGEFIQRDMDTGAVSRGKIF
jgi:hypothetical protein